MTCYACIHQSLHICLLDALRLYTIRENNSAGKSYERGIEVLVPILLPTAYTCFGVPLEKCPCPFL